MSDLDTDRPEGRAWHRLTPADQAALVAAGNSRTFQSGDIIALQGGPPNSMHVILRGWVKISVTNDRGDSAPIAARGPGDIIGELGPITGRPRTATMQAIDEVHTLSVPKERLRAVLVSSPDIASELLRSAAFRLEQSDRLRLESGGPDFTARLAALLVELARQCAPDATEDGPIDLPFMQEELASFARVSRSTLIRGLDELRKLALVQTGRRKVTVLRLQNLRQVAAGRGDPPQETD